MSIVDAVLLLSVMFLADAVVFVDLTMPSILIDMFTRNIYVAKHAKNSIKPMFKRAGIRSGRIQRFVCRKQTHCDNKC